MAQVGHLLAVQGRYPAVPVRCLHTALNPKAADSAWGRCLLGLGLGLDLVLVLSWAASTQPLDSG